jgi:hypothetical protein
MQMQLMTKELRSKLPPLYSTEGKGKAPIIAKFFHPLSGCTIWITEANEEDGDLIMFGLTDLGDPSFAELGYTSLNELKSVKVGGLGIERDLYFEGYELDYSNKEVREIATGRVEWPSRQGEPEKEGWQMTRDEVAGVEFQSADGITLNEHRSVVERALKEGKAISAAVLAEYPDLVATLDTFATKPAKEPWEMTFPEFQEWAKADVDRQWSFPDSVLRTGLAALGFKGTYSKFIDVKDAAEFHYTDGGYAYTDLGHMQFHHAMHQAVVEHALKSLKVSDAVLESILETHELLYGKEDPEKKLRAIWNAKGVAPEIQDAIIADVTAKAQPGAKVGPFVIGGTTTPAPKAPESADEKLLKAHQKGTCDAFCKFCYAEVAASLKPPTDTIQ